MMKSRIKKTQIKHFTISEEDKFRKTVEKGVVSISPFRGGRTRHFVACPSLLFLVFLYRF